jgi:hypothetical protein
MHHHEPRPLLHVVAAAVFYCVDDGDEGREGGEALGIWICAVFKQ